MSDPKWLAKAEALANPHNDRSSLACYQKWRVDALGREAYKHWCFACSNTSHQIVPAIALALEEAHAEGQRAAMEHLVRDTEEVRIAAHAAGKAEGRRESFGEGWNACADDRDKVR